MIRCADFADFLDLSPEELRLEAYTAMQQGSVDVYVSGYLIQFVLPLTGG